ncbi:MAG: YopX family protein [Huintestinicola sp.]
MREILFRGKRSDNGKWVKGYLYITHIGAHEIGSYDAEINIERFTFDVIPETVGQYTGLTDKNGTKIFEGDIVSLRKCNELIYKVVYDNFRFELHNKNDTACYVLSIYKSKDFEIIGNIHDNPEILKGGEENG